MNEAAKLCKNCKHWRIELELEKLGACMKGPGAIHRKLPADFDGMTWLLEQDVYPLTLPGAWCSSHEDRE